MLDVQHECIIDLANKLQAIRKNPFGQNSRACQFYHSPKMFSFVFTLLSSDVVSFASCLSRQN